MYLLTKITFYGFIPDVLNQCPSSSLKFFRPGLHLQPKQKPTLDNLYIQNILFF